MRALRAAAVLACSALAGAAYAANDAPKTPPAATAPATPAAPPPALAGGATAVTEAHGDWAVGCQVAQARKVCVVSQQQIDQKTRQRLVSIEFAGGSPKSAAGAVTLPFGLLLSAGATFELDGAAFGQPAQFRTCLPIGCVAPVGFEGAALDKLKAGTTLTISAKAADSGQAVRFPVPLRGLASALGRAAELTAN